MKRVLAIIFLVVIVLGAWFLFIKEDKVSTDEEPKVEALKVKKHSEEFNQKVGDAINSYLQMKNAFVDADSANVKLNAGKFISAVDSIPLHELDKDDSMISTAAAQQVGELKANAAPILQENDLTEMRRHAL